MSLLTAISCHMARLKCSVCTKLRNHLEPAFIDGSTTVKTSSFNDHIAIEKCTRSLWLFLTESRAINYIKTASIVEAHNLDTASPESIKKKFDIAYFITKEDDCIFHPCRVFLSLIFKVRDLL